MSESIEGSIPSSNPKMDPVLQQHIRHILNGFAGSIVEWSNDDYYERAISVYHALFPAKGNLTIGWLWNKKSYSYEQVYEVYHHVCHEMLLQNKRALTYLWLVHALQKTTAQINSTKIPFFERHGSTMIYQLLSEIAQTQRVPFEQWKHCLTMLLNLPSLSLCEDFLKKNESYWGLTTEEIIQKCADSKIMTNINIHYWMSHFPSLRIGTDDYYQSHNVIHGEESSYVHDIPSHIIYRLNIPVYWANQHKKEQSSDVWRAINFFGETVNKYHNTHDYTIKLRRAVEILHGDVFHNPPPIVIDNLLRAISNGPQLPMIAYGETLQQSLGYVLERYATVQQRLDICKESRLYSMLPAEQYTTWQAQVSAWEGLVAVGCGEIIPTQASSTSIKEIPLLFS